MQTGSFIVRVDVARRSVWAGVLLAAAGAAWAEERFDAGEAPVAGIPALWNERGNDPLAAPRFVRSERPLPRVMASSPAQFHALAGHRVELLGLSHRWWHSNDRTDIGVGLGMMGQNVIALDGRSESAQPLHNPVASVSVGIRLRMSPDSALYADASSARGLFGKGSDAYFTKLGVEWQGAPRSGWAFASGGVGLRLDAGKTMTMRIKGGGLGLVLRSKF